jgi:hypothetical protein
MKLGTLASSFRALAEIRALKLKAVKAFELKAFFKRVEGEVKLYDEARIEKAKEFGTLDEEKDMYAFTDENAKKFNEEMAALNDKEIAIDIPVLTPADLGDQEVSVEALDQLEWLIK